MYPKPKHRCPIDPFQSPRVLLYFFNSIVCDSLLTGIVSCRHVVILECSLFPEFGSALSLDVAHLPTQVQVFLGEGGGRRTIHLAYLAFKCGSRPEKCPHKTLLSLGMSACFGDRRPTRSAGKAPNKAQVGATAPHARCLALMLRATAAEDGTTPSPPPLSRPPPPANCRRYRRSAWCFSLYPPSRPSWYCSSSPHRELPRRRQQPCGRGGEAPAATSSNSIRATGTHTSTGTGINKQVSPQATWKAWTSRRCRRWSS